MMILLRKEFSKWREWLDLEHDNCYGPLNRWNAGTDGHWKYVFRATVNQELLWNLDNDPAERYNLANDSKYKDILVMWRNRIVDQFIRENRGEEYVKNRTLVQRLDGRTFSPHYDRPDFPRYYWRPKNQQEQIYGVLPADLVHSLSHSEKKISTQSTSSQPSEKHDQVTTKLFYFFLSSLAAILAVKGKRLLTLARRS